MTINWVGLWTLYTREIARFLKVWNQTITAPMVTTLLFLAIFSLALGGAGRMIGGLPFEVFIAPGLIMMAMVQNASANTSSSFMLQKFQGVIVDLLMPPLSAAEITIGMTLGGLTRGLMVGVAVTAAVYYFVPFSVHDVGLALFYAVGSSLMMALLGMVTGIWAQSFDQMAAITNYVITPLSFLSGTFYSITMLPGIWHDISLFNPFFYMIDGFRYAMTGHADGDINTGMMVIVGVNVFLFSLTHYLLVKGYRLKT